MYMRMRIGDSFQRFSDTVSVNRTREGQSTEERNIIPLSVDINANAVHEDLHAKKTEIKQQTNNCLCNACGAMGLGHLQQEQKIGNNFNIFVIKLF